MLADYYAHIPTNELRLSNDLTDEEFRKEFEEIANKYQVFPIPADYNIEEQVNVHVKDLSALVSMHVALVSRVMGTDAANMTDEIQIFTHLFLSKYNQLDENICCDSPLESDSSKSDRAIIRRKNMLTLLNLADDINCFGTLQNLNEMGGMGENSIKDVKEKVNKYKNRTNNEITKHTLSRIIQECSLQQYSHDLQANAPKKLGSIKDNQTKEVFKECCDVVKANNSRNTKWVHYRRKKGGVKIAGESSCYGPSSDDDDSCI